MRWRSACANSCAAEAAFEGVLPTRREVHEKIADLQAQKEIIMDVEHINAIGNHLADLTKRTADLRGYL